jgi:hypothetical protein
MKENSNIKKLAGFLPIFNGFYNTLYDCDLSDEMYELGLPQGFDWTNYFDNAGYQLAVVKSACEVIEGWLKDTGIEKVEFEEIISPKEYNFVNDAVDVKYHIDIEKFGNFIRDFINKNDGLWDYYLLRYKSRDGFISYYSCDADVWKELTNDYTNFETLEGDSYTARRFYSHVIGSLLEFYLGTIKGADASLELYYDIGVSAGEYLNIPKKVINSEKRKQKRLNK